MGYFLDQNSFILTNCFPPTFKFRNVSQIWLYPMQLITTFHLINCFWYIDFLMFLSMFYQKIIFRIDSQHTCKCDSVVLICKKIIFSPSEKYLNKTNSMLVIVMPKMKTLTIHDKKIWCCIPPFKQIRNARIFCNLKTYTILFLRMFTC